MALEVDITKKLDGFFMHMQFRAEQEIFAILGASGCGKSMTLKCIAGIEKPDEGRIVLDGKVLFDSEKKINLPPQKRKVGYMFQDYALFPHMNIYENIAFGLKLKKLPKEEIRKKVKHVLDMVDLEGFEDRKISTLSGGQQQRICIARALAVQPEVLLMDEPTSALDPISTAKIEELMEDLKKKYTVIVVTHNMQQATRVSDQTAFFLVGEMVEFGDTRKIFTNPDKVETQNYITGRFG